MRLPATYSRRMAPDMAHSDAYGLNCLPRDLKIASRYDLYHLDIVSSREAHARRCA